MFGGQSKFRFEHRKDTKKYILYLSLLNLHSSCGADNRNVVHGVGTSASLQNIGCLDSQVTEVVAQMRRWRQRLKELLNSSSIRAARRQVILMKERKRR